MLVGVYGDLGFDFVWLDFEHGGASPDDTEHLAALARVCEVAGIDPLVWLPGGDPLLVRKALDAGRPGPVPVLSTRSDRPSCADPTV